MEMIRDGTIKSHIPKIEEALAFIRLARPVLGVFFVQNIPEGGNNVRNDKGNLDSYWAGRKKN